MGQIHRLLIYFQVSYKKFIQKIIFYFDYLQLNLLECYYMQRAEKKKRSNSGSRSKSRKYKTEDLSVDIKVRKLSVNHNQPTKNKTENSSSLNKSKPSRKTSIKQQKKLFKSSNKDAKDQASQSVSADRKHSLTKMNKTEENYENEQIQKSTFAVRMKLKQLKLPTCTNIELLQNYLESIRDCFTGAGDSIYGFCMELHKYYISPLQPLFEMLLPYEVYLRRKEEIGRQIDHQIFENEKLWEELSPVDVEIFKLKEKIEENRSLIEKKRKNKHLRTESEIQQKNKANQPKSYPSQWKTAGIQTKQLVRPQKIQHIGKGFKLDLEQINKEGQAGFHEQFYSKLQQFSQSWRNQALKQKRF